MPVRTPEARQLCTKTELELYQAGLARAVKTLTPTRLKSKTGRARKLRDKYRQLADSQDREARGKQEPRRRRIAKGSTRTRRKEKLFAETLQRFQDRLATVEKEKKRAEKKKVAAKATTKKKTMANRTTARKAPAAKKSPAAKTSPVAKKKAAVKTASKAQGRPRGTDVSTKSAAAQSRTKRSGQKRKQLHIAAEGRRRQAKRDVR